MKKRLKVVALALAVLCAFSIVLCSCGFDGALPAILFMETDKAKSLLEKNYTISYVDEAPKATIDEQIDNILSTWFIGFDIYVPNNSFPIMFNPKDSYEDTKSIGGTMLEIDGKIGAYHAYTGKYPDVESLLSDIGEVANISLDQPVFLPPCEYGANEYSTLLLFDCEKFVLQIICLTENELDSDWNSNWKSFKPLRFLICSKELCYSEIGDNFNPSDYKYTSVDYLKCEYLFKMIAHELLSDFGSDYARIYDDVKITDHCGDWYEINFSAEEYQVMSRETDKVICYAWVYSTFDFEDAELVGVQYESFFNAPHKYFYITRKLADEEFDDYEIEECKKLISWGVPVSRKISSEVSLWGTVHSNEYHTDFWLDEPILIQIGDMYCDISRIEIDDPYMFSTMISGKPITECDREHLFLTGTITNSSEDFSLVKFYTLREAVIGEDIPYLAATDSYETELTGYVRYNEKTDLCDIVLNTPTELTTINGYTELTNAVRVWPSNYNFADDSVMNYIGQAVQVQGLVDYEFGVFTIRPTAITTSMEVPQQDIEVTYNNALDAVETYLACCGEIAPYAERNSIGAEAYMLAKSNLIACGDYGQTQYWLNCINAIEDLCISARDANLMISNGTYSYSAPAVSGFSVSVSDDLITIQNNNFYQGEGTDLTLSYSFDQKSFTATISPVYNDHMKGVDGETLRIVVALFTKIYEDEALKNSLIESFSDDEEGKSVELDWGGYHLNIVTTNESNYSRSIIVTGTQIN